MEPMEARHDALRLQNAIRFIHKKAIFLIKNISETDFTITGTKHTIDNKIHDLSSLIILLFFYNSN